MDDHSKNVLHQSDSFRCELVISSTRCQLWGRGGGGGEGLSTIYRLLFPPNPILNRWRPDMPKHAGLHLVTTLQPRSEK